jgi:hypothetical protein
MNFAKLSIFALSFGLFVASCGDQNKEAATENPIDSTATMEPMTTEPAMMDTATAPMVDSAAGKMEGGNMMADSAKTTK